MPPGDVSTAPSAQTETVVVYTNPMTSSGYDPDGIQSLLTQDEIDWDAFDWEGWSWVVHPDLDNTPSWEDLSWDEREDWWDDNRDDLDEDAIVNQYGQVDFTNDGTLGTVYDEMRASGAEGGTEINYDYYTQDPWYNLAFANLDIDIDAEEGLTEENLQEATKYIVETFRSVMNDGYREPWDAELPAPWKPVEMTTDYETPFEIPGIVPRSASPTMGPALATAAKDAGLWNVSGFNMRKQLVPPQPGFKGEGKPDEFKTAEERAIEGAASIGSALGAL